MPPDNKAKNTNSYTSDPTDNTNNNNNNHIDQSIPLPNMNNEKQ